MYKICLVNSTLQITCQWIGIEQYKFWCFLNFCTSRNGWIFRVFYSRTVFDHISLVFHYFEQILFFVKTGVHCTVCMKRGWGDFGGQCRGHRRRKKGINFRVINLTLGPIPSKKVSPDNPKSVARGVGVWKCYKSHFLESSNTLY